MKKPNFFIIGAPKCGTTSLVTWLSEHPNIYVPPIKEPHFFNTDGLVGTKSLSEYERLFKEAGSKHIAVGEASTRYLFSKVAMPNILKYNPDAKFIVCLRNPIEMAQAQHSELLCQGRETVEDFEKAWHIQKEREQGKHIPLITRSTPALFQYGAYCCLGEQLSRALSYVPTNQLMTIVLDDMKTQPRRVYLKVLSFLGLADDERMEFPVINKNKLTKSVVLATVIKMGWIVKKKLGVKKMPFSLLTFMREKNTIQMKRQDVSPELKAELIAFFRADVELLSTLLKRDLSHWLSIK